MSKSPSCRPCCSRSSRPRCRGFSADRNILPQNLRLHSIDYGCCAAFEMGSANSVQMQRNSCTSNIKCPPLLIEKEPPYFVFTLLFNLFSASSKGMSKYEHNVRTLIIYLFFSTGFFLRDNSSKIPYTLLHVKSNNGRLASYHFCCLRSIYDFFQINHLQVISGSVSRNIQYALWLSIALEFCVYCCLW